MFKALIILAPLFLLMGKPSSPAPRTPRFTSSLSEQGFRNPVGSDILCSGSSYVWGWGVNDGEPWCNQLGGINDGYNNIKLPTVFHRFKHRSPRIERKIHIVGMNERSLEYVEHEGNAANAILLKMIQLNKEKKAKFVVVYLPWPNYHRGGSHRVERKLIRFAKKHPEMRLVNMSPYARQLTYDDTSHFTKEANALIAQVIKKELKLK